MKKIVLSISVALLVASAVGFASTTTKKNAASANTSTCVCSPCIPNCACPADCK